MPRRRAPIPSSRTASSTCSNYTGCGAGDTFHLDGAAHIPQAVLDGLHVKSGFYFLPDRTHFDLYVQGKDRQGLFKQISWEMYAVARPDSALKPAVAMP